MKTNLHKKKTPADLIKPRSSVSEMLRAATRHSAYAFATTLGVWLPRAEASTLVNVDATTLPVGPASTLSNTGTLPGDFISVGAVVPGVTNIDGINAVAMSDVPGAVQGQYYQGPATPAALGGASPRTVEAWIFDPGPRLTAGQIQYEKTIFSFGRRVAGGNFALEHGLGEDVGAVSVSTVENTALGNIGWNGAKNVKTNNWTYLVATYDGRTLAVYSDGVLRNSETYDPYVKAVNTALRSSDGSANTLMLIARQSIDNAGATPSGAGIGPFYLGRLRVQDTNMSAAQILTQYNAEKAAFNYKDTDGNGLADWWQLRYFGALGQNPAADPDGDGLTNLQEYQAGTDPHNPDTDGDGLTDGYEVNTSHTDPTLADTDGDGLSDGYEVNTSLTNPLNPDTDGDGFSDGVEVAKGTDPKNAASFPSAVVNLDATSLALGALPSWTNNGTVGGTFDSVSATNIPTVTNIFGIKGVNFTIVGGAGTNGTSYLGPAQPVSITGANPRSIEMWVYNDTVQDEHTMFSFGARGGTGLNVSFGEGRQANYGAAAQWGGPDIGWNNQEVYGRWVELAYSYDGDTTRLYVDGKLANQEVDSGANGNGLLNTQYADSNGQPYHFRISRQNALNQPYTVIDGTGFGPHTISRVRVFDVALDQASIAARFNAEKSLYGLTDTDADGMPDWFEDRFGLNKNDPSDASITNLNSDISNLAKYQAGYAIPTQGGKATIALDPNKPDFDGDGLKDGAELHRIGGHYRPGQFAPTNPFSRDTDGDGLADGAETDTGVYVSPLNTGSDPLNTDSDGDTYLDGLEVAQGSDPNNPASVPSPLPLINLDATTAPLGQLNVWTNTGRLNTNFVAETGLAINNTGGIVQTVQGVNGLTLNGGTYKGPAATLLTGNPNYSIEAWVFNPSLQDEECIIGWGRRGGPNDTMSAFTDGSDGTWGAMTHWGDDISWNGANVRTPTRWKYLVFTYDGSSQTNLCYSDGTLASTRVTAPLAIVDSDDGGATHYSFRVGDENASGDVAASTGTPGFLFSGTIGEIRIYTRTLPPSEISANFTAGAAKYGITSDIDGLPIWWKRVYGFPVGTDVGALDPDNDGASNLQEYFAGTDPLNPDSDGDGLMDGQEINVYGTNPNNKDTDLDGVPDGREVALGINPLSPDTDGDSFPDSIELLYGSNPNDGASVPNISNPVPFVNLDATGLPLGALPVWTNNNGLGWSFVASTNSLGVSTVDGTKAVTFDGASWYTGLGEPALLSGNAARSVVAWVWNPAAATEETVFAWGRRGGNPDGSNMALSHGTDPAFGAVQHWGSPDVPWGATPSAIASNVVTRHWTFIGVSYDPNTATDTVYKDGVPVYSKSITNSAGAPLATWLYDPSDPLNAGSPQIGKSLPFRVGAQNDANGGPSVPFASMSIAKIRAYDQTLSAAQIAAQYNAEKVQFPGQPVITNVAVNSGTGVITFDWVPAPGKTYSVETNSSLTNPNGWAAEATGQTSGSYSHAAGGSNKYYRLRVE